MLSGTLTNVSKSSSVENVRDAFFVNLLDPANVMFPDTYIDQLHEANVGVENVTTAAPWEDQRHTFERFSQWLALFNKHCEKIHRVERTDDIEEARSRGKVGIILGLQGASPIGESLDSLLAYQKLGLRVLGLAYQRRNMFADGCGEPRDSGLSQLGERLIEETNRLGIVIDLSHSGRTSALEAIELSKDPVMFSHSNVKALCRNVRNLDDEQIKAVAEKGGIMGIAAYGPLLRSEARSTMKDLLDHIDYVVKLVGSDHVGLGLDLNPPTPKQFFEEFKRRFPEIAGNYAFETTVESFSSPTEWPKIMEALLTRGYSHDEIRDILGGNSLRVFKRVWRS